MFEIINVFNKYPFMVACLTQIILSPMFISSPETGWSMASFVALVFSELWAIEVWEKKNQRLLAHKRGTRDTDDIMRQIFQTSDDGQAGDTNYVKSICLTVQNTSTGEIKQAKAAIVSNDLNTINLITAIIHQYAEQEK
jgi:hypothetical protein